MFNLESNEFGELTEPNVPVLVGNYYNQMPGVDYLATCTPTRPAASLFEILVATALDVDCGLYYRHLVGFGVIESTVGMDICIRFHHGQDVLGFSSTHREVCSCWTGRLVKGTRSGPHDVR